MGEVLLVEGRVVVGRCGLFDVVLGCGEGTPSLCLFAGGGEIEISCVFFPVGGEIEISCVFFAGGGEVMGRFETCPYGWCVGGGEIALRRRLVGSVGDGAEGWVAFGEFALGVLAVVEEELVGLGGVAEVTVGGVFFGYVCSEEGD